MQNLEVEIFQITHMNPKDNHYAISKKRMLMNKVLLIKRRHLKEA